MPDSTVDRLEGLRASLERHERVDRMRERFTVALAEDLRRPLAEAEAELELLLDRRPGAQTQGQATILCSVHASIQRLLEVIEDFSLLAALEAGTKPLRPRLFDAAAVAREGLRDAYLPVKRRGLELTAELPREPARLCADPELFAAVLQNLLANALCFAKGAVSVALRAAPGRLELRVADDGPGIPEARLPDLFERVALPERGPGDGPARSTALGLATCRRVMLLHGGTIRALRAPGGGTEFVASWPALPAPAAPRGAAGAAVW